MTSRMQDMAGHGKGRAWAVSGVRTPAQVSSSLPAVGDTG